MNKIYKDALKHQVFKIISDVSTETGVSSYVVGGFVRDYLLGIKNDDIDIVVEGSGIEFAKYFSDKVHGKLSYFENYGTASVKWKDIEIEFVGARKETYERGSRKPIVEEGTLYDDISRRDFTINAMALSLNHDNYGELIDYFNGFHDLNLKIIKTPLNPDVTFSDDPLRMFRAIRFATKLNGFLISDSIKESIKKNSYRCDILSRERITDEITKMLSYDNPKNGLVLLNELNLWDWAFPRNKFNDVNVFCASDNNNIVVRWFFISMNYESDYLSFIHEMKLSKELAKKLEKIKYTFDNFKDMNFPDISKVRHCLDFSGRYAFTAIFSVLSYVSKISNICDNDILDWYDYTYRIFNENLEFIDYVLPCDGKVISQYSLIPEGKELGYLIKLIKEEILSGRLNSTKDSVLAYATHVKFMKKY